jgi:hypothetical protein
MVKHLNVVVLLKLSNVNLILGMQLFCVSSNVDDDDWCSFFVT